tara:strand:+ start:247 stop:945 length:699 start_codon:yes stop_codon:yes gene_type:complete
MLPKVDFPSYFVNLSSIKEKVKYRPYTIAEEKVLLMANESRETKEIFDATVDICQSCVLTDIDIKTLPIFDLEKLLIAIRSKSVGEEIEVMASCPYCEEKTKVTINIEKMVTDETEVPTKKIMLSDTVGICLEYPNIGTATTRAFIETMSISDAIACCISQVFDENEVFPFHKEKLEDQILFVESLSAEFIKTINEEFFNKMPINTINMDYTCPHCKEKVERRFENLIDFFI